MLDRVVEFFMPRVGELLVDHVHENIKDFMFTFDSLRRNLAILSAKASDIDNEIQNGEIAGKRKRKREVEEWMAAVKSIETEFSQLENEVGSQGFISRFLGGGRAAQLNQSVDGLIQQSRHFGELLLDVCQTMGEALHTTKLIGNTFEENLERIWRLLSIEKVSSLGIYGMGGVGKTTLAKHINNRLLGQSEERVIWVTVSQAFTIRKLQDEVARVVGMDLSNEENEDKRAARLWRALSGRKNILLLDDIWEKINLEKVGYPLSEEGFRLIITTRSVEVCRRIGCKEVIVVKTLPKDESWKLFSETLGNETILAPQVEEIAKRMSEMCDGLPLGIVVLAGSMRGETAIHVWRNALEELKEYSGMGRADMEDEVFEVLKYSFDRLNPYKRRQRQSSNVEQLCFLYCSLYPEDHEMSRDELVKKFISEGLMDEKKGRRKQVDQGHCIVDKLVNVCLLESVGSSGVKMHDLVRSMALKITEGTTMVIAGQRSLKEILNEEEWTKDLAKVSLMRNGIEQIPSGMSPNCPNLSTLILCHNPLTFLSDSFFSILHGLCTLDLSETWIEKLPDSLSVLERLEVLLLCKCSKLVYVPYLGNLKALRELDLWDTAIQELPSGIDELIHIEYLAVYSPYLEMFPSGLLLRFPNLRRLCFPTILEAPMEESEKLKQLEYFTGCVKNVCDLNQFIRSRVHDTVYVINVGAAQFEFYCRQVLPGNYDHQVRFYKYNLKNREEKDEAVSGHDIEAVAILSCEGSHVLLDDFQGLIGNTKCLKMLKVLECGGTECILKESQSQPFSALEHMDLRKLGDLQGIIITEKRETVASAPSRQPLFSSLTELVIGQCHKMKNLGLPVSEFPILEQLTVYDCSEIEELMEVRSGEGEARLVYLPRLRTLLLEKLPRLKSICSNATVICGSIESIRLENCPGLKKFPLDPPPLSLRQISMYEEEWASLEWEDPSHPLLLQPILRRLY